LFIPLLLLLTSVHVNHDGGVAQLHDGTHEYSSWDIVNHAPTSCYTETLFDVVLTLSNVKHVLMFGLGGGVLSARLARVGIHTTVVEWSQHVIDVYHAVFHDSIREWVGDQPGTGCVTIVQDDALTYDTGDTGDTDDTGDMNNNHNVLIVDIPQCYRDVSSECVVMLHHMLSKKTCIVANVWMQSAKQFYRAFNDDWGRFVSANERIGTLVWVSYACF